MTEQIIPACVLIVDDDPAKLTALAAAVESPDVEIVTATSGTEALGKLLAQDFAVVLLDVNMPIMDGFETAATIRLRPKSEHLPIIFITAERLDDDAMLNGYQLGAVDYVLSPVLPQILRTKVAVFCDLYRLREQSKRTEEQIQRLNAELEQRVAQRTAQLQAALADLEGFSYSVSHDLRAPLRAIDGFCAMLREDYAPRLDAEGQRLLQVVSDNAQKMGKLIDDILAFSRAGRLELRLAELDMNALVEQVWQELEPRRTGRNIGFHVADLPGATGDHAAMHQVWQNMLDNAVKFTRRMESAQIEVGGRCAGGENTYFIRDNGAGFDMAYAHKLYGLFQRLHGMEEFEGTGVGLAIVKRYVAKHGGRVWAEGKVGEGATFWFALPAGTIAK